MKLIKRNKLFLYGIIMTLLAVFVTPVFFNAINTDTGVNYAQAQSEPYKFLEPIPGVGGEIDVDNDLPEFIKTLITLVIGFSILLAIFMIIAGGFEYMTSRSPNDTNDAKRKMGNAIIGLALALASVVILQTINPELIELKSVDTVTTTGESLAPDDESEE